jgi:hypothetical protein
MAVPPSGRVDPLSLVELLLLLVKLCYRHDLKSFLNGRRRRNGKNIIF